ncbi:adenylate/guanylate cyclase domain-containing protein [Carboxylicivirga sp. N1Y90]|uniref:adenylate/guanylate cyclase domain-containing protein n=1 Tax=Carboxylicivirga fragile TaxID=3417571 RepID=UPI003D349C8B
MLMLTNNIVAIKRCFFFQIIPVLILFLVSASNFPLLGNDQYPQIRVDIQENKKQQTLCNSKDSTCYITNSTFSLHWDYSDQNWALTRFRLLPNYNEWSKWTKRHSHTFFDLKDGKYILEIQTSNGIEYEKTLLINVPIWKKASFYIWLVLTIAFFTILFLVIYFSKRIKVAERRVELRLKKDFRLKLKAGPEKSGVLANAVKEQARIRSRKYQRVTVLFADIQGFTRIVEHINPELLIDELDRFFFYFDEVVEKYNIEKIKTIGDAYMCAGGLPNKNRTNPIEVVLAGLDMQRFMEMSKLKHKGDYGFWELRIGIHTGPVISGELGRKNVSFDIWGDTVNIASRMESSGTAGMINITGVTYQLIKEFFECEYRGKMPIKYKGETDMYYVKRIKPNLSADEKGITPNRQFYTKLQHIRFGDLEEYILSKLDNELMEGLSYHNKAHTVDVLTQIEVLARAEKVGDEDLLLLKTAALLHDIGFILEYENHEDNSIKFAKEILPKYNYVDYQIKQVVELIDITRVGQQPRNFLEKILKDADLDYLGRADFIPVSESLFKELNMHSRPIEMEEWNKMQFQFISDHTYYTSSARKLRQVNKERQLQKLKELISL